MQPNVFERQYRDRGFRAQRLYPNEELLRFMGRSFFGLEPEARAQIRILEVGCGSGANLWMIAREGFQAHGVDLSLSGLLLCRQMLAHWDADGALACADATSLPYADSSLDAVVDVVSLQHLDLAAHARSLREIRRVLRPGGLFFSYHLGANSYSFTHANSALVDRCTVEEIRNPEAPLHGNGPTCFLSVDDARELLNDSGFETLSVERVVKSYGATAIQLEYLTLEGRRSEVASASTGARGENRDSHAC